MAAIQRPSWLASLDNFLTGELTGGGGVVSHGGAAGRRLLVVAVGGIPAGSGAVLSFGQPPRKKGRHTVRRLAVRLVVDAPLASQTQLSVEIDAGERFAVLLDF